MGVERRGKNRGRREKSGEGRGKGERMKESVVREVRESESRKSIE